jgi:hypothetical protein
MEGKILMMNRKDLVSPLQKQYEGIEGEGLPKSRFQFIGGFQYIYSDHRSSAEFVYRTAYILFIKLFPRSILLKVKASIPGSSLCTGILDGCTKTMILMRSIISSWMAKIPMEIQSNRCSRGF